MTRIPMLAAATLALFASSAPAAAQPAHDPFPPKYDDAMAALCRSPASDRSCVLGDRKLSYWFSFDTVVDGRKWYTAIAIARPRGGVGDGVGPDSKLLISQVTYELKNGVWTPIARQVGFGAVYVNNTGNPSREDDDGDADYFRQPLPDGVLVGFPTVTMAGEGINMHGHVIFRSTPDKSGNWRFGGEIADASDDWNGCNIKETPQDCYRSYAKLSLTGKTVSGWPEILTTQTGTLPGPGGNPRRAKPSDSFLWHFDAAQRGYTANK